MKDSKESQKDNFKRHGVFIGAYVPEDLKVALSQEAKGDHRTLSQQITKILSDHIRQRERIPQVA